MKCTVCPRACGTDRSIHEGACHAGRDMRVAAIVVHRGEEPPLVTGVGSGAVFFGGCPLQCPYCQNRQISHTGYGHILGPDALAEYLLKLQAMGCTNINLVSPSPYAPHIVECLAMARSGGLSIPVVLNSSGYERIETLELLLPYISIYLMDIKYGDNQTGRQLSAVADYWDRTRDAVTWLWEQVGALRTDTAGAAVSGLLIRHLVLPGMISNPFAVLEFVAELSPRIPVSIMAQYNPAFYNGENAELHRRVSEAEYAVVLERAAELGIETVFAQSLDAPQSYTPDFTAARPFGEGLNLLCGLAIPPHTHGFEQGIEIKY